MDDTTASPRPENLVSDFRLRMYMAFGFVTILFLLPYSINHFVQGRFVMALLTLTIVVLAGANALWILRHKRQLVPFAYFYTVIQATLVAGLFLQGSTILFWCYPSAFIILSIAEQRSARIMLCISIALMIPAALYAISVDIVARFAITYIMVCYLGDVVVHLLDSVHAQQTRLATTDPLTGAYNCRHMLTCLANAAESCRRGMGTASLIAIDIDHFKNVNDSFGHASGDEALQGLVNTLLRRKRRLDEVFRTGGEEFIVLAHNIQADQAVIFAESLRIYVEQASILDEQPITVSMGVASYEKDEAIEDWIRRADLNLYEAKARGRNRVWPAPTAPPTASFQSALSAPSSDYELKDVMGI